MSKRFYAVLFMMLSILLSAILLPVKMLALETLPDSFLFEAALPYHLQHRKLTGVFQIKSRQ